MKKMKRIAVAMIMVLLLTLAMPVFAVPDYNSPTLPRIIDDTDILSSSEKYDKVMELITWISEKHRLDVVILLEADSMYDRQDYNGITYYDSEYKKYLADFYESGGDFEVTRTASGGITMLDGKASYGIGAKRSGLIFGLDLAGGRRGDRNFRTTTLGDAMKLLPDEKLEQAHQYFEPLLRSGEYYEALIVYLETTIDILEGRLQLRSLSLKNVGIAFLATGTIAAIITLGIALSMSNVSKGKYAGNYLVENSFQLRGMTDIYTHTTTTRTKVSSDSNSGGRSGGGGGVSSSGSSFGGSGGRF